MANPAALMVMVLKELAPAATEAAPALAAGLAVKAATATAAARPSRHGPVPADTARREAPEGVAPALAGAISGAAGTVTATAEVEQSIACEEPTAEFERDAALPDATETETAGDVEPSSGGAGEPNPAAVAASAEETDGSATVAPAGKLDCDNLGHGVPVAAETDSVSAPSQVAAIAAAAATRGGIASVALGENQVGCDVGSETPVAPAMDDGPSNRIAAIAACRSVSEFDWDEQRALAASWWLRARAEQRAPGGDWRTWVLMGGRGAGKTRAGAEWVHEAVTAAGPRCDLRVALVAETLGDAREVMVDGVSGICRIAAENRPVFEVTRRRVVWPNGAIGQVFSSEDPESLRGPQFHLAWCDELAKWKYAAETWDMLQFGLRLGARPRQLATTTPRPLKLLKEILAARDTAVTRIRTADNLGNLAPGFLSAIEARYGGTRLGRQELDGELIDDREDALWRRADLERIRTRQPGPIGRIVVAVDPPAAAGARNSCCGIVVAGLDGTGRAVVLADGSVEGASPAGWARAAVRLYRRFDADRIVAEVNQGGDMVSAVLRSIDATVPLTTVRATRGKWLRAEPIAALYEQGRVLHADAFPSLEDQMCDFGPDGLSSGRSPDRLDALVWALTALMGEGRGEPRVRGM